MNLLLFWIKVAARRFVSLFKTSPIVVIGAIVILAAIIAAGNSIEIFLDTQRFVFAAALFFLVSLLRSFGGYPAMSLLILYSKSRLKNKHIQILFFIRRAFFNNILLFIFDVFVLFGKVRIDNSYIMPIATVCSVVMSFMVMYLRNEFSKGKIKKITFKRSIFSPVIKSTVHDYLTRDFLQAAVPGIALFIIVIVEFITNKISILRMGSQPLFFTGMLIVLSIGFMGINDSIHNINWKFLSVVSCGGFGYHFKRTFVFLISFFSLPIILFVFMVSSASAFFLLKYLYCLAVLLLSSIFISFFVSFSSGSLIFKLAMLLLIFILTGWISVQNAAFLPVLLIPALAFFLKAKNDYREWYYQ